MYICMYIISIPGLGCLLCSFPSYISYMLYKLRVLLFQYGMWPSTAVTTISYATPSVAGPTTTAFSSLGTSIPGQYYVFHPKLSRADPSAAEKPSLLEMENSYLVKHSTAPFAPAIMPNVLTGAQFGNPAAGMYL